MVGIRDSIRASQVLCQAETYSLNDILWLFIVVMLLIYVFPHENFTFLGKVLGGSSSTNVCLHHRGSADDYNAWGVPGWSAREVLPYFKASQKDETGRDPEYHGKDGLWVMDEVKYQNPLSKRFLEVGDAAGLGTNDDFNSWKKPQDGVGRFQVSESHGERVSGASAYLSQAKHRKNLTVRSGVMVRKVNFDGSKTATGVTYDILGDDTMAVSCHLSFCC